MKIVSIKLKIKQLLCKHEPTKKYLIGGYCTFGDAYTVRCNKCDKLLGSGIDKY